MIHTEYYIAYDDKNCICIEDYYSCMASIYSQWQQRTQGNGIFRFMLHDYTEEFELLEWMVFLESELEWRALPLVAKELRWHLMRLEFVSMLQHVKGEINEILRKAEYEMNDENDIPELLYRTDAKYSHYKKDLPSMKEKWQRAYKDRWRENGIIWLGTDSPLWADTMEKEALRTETIKVSEALYYLAKHVQSRIDISCNRILSKVAPSMLERAEWIELIRSAYIDYIKREGHTLERNLKKCAEKYKWVYEDVQTDQWVKVYKDVLSEFANNIKHCEEHKELGLKPKIGTWVMDALEDELYLPYAENVVDRLMEEFQERIKTSDASGDLYRSFTKKMEELFESAHRVNFIKCSIRPALYEQYNQIVHPQSTVDDYTSRANNSTTNKHNFDFSCFVIKLRGKNVDYVTLRERLSPFVHEIKFTHQWYAVFALFRDWGILGTCDQTHFAEKMKEWFPEVKKQCSANEISKFQCETTKKDRSLWPEEYARVDFTNPRASLDAYRRICILYDEIHEAIKTPPTKP